MVNPSTSKEKHGNAKSKELSLNLHCERIYIYIKFQMFMIFHLCSLHRGTISTNALTSLQVSNLCLQTSVLSGCFPKSGVVIPLYLLLHVVGDASENSGSPPCVAPPFPMENEENSPWCINFGQSHHHGAHEKTRHSNAAFSINTDSSYSPNPTS